MMKLSTMKTIVDTVKYYRASANFVFYFQKDGRDFYLRCNRADERNKVIIGEEIKILHIIIKNNKGFSW